MKLSEGKSNPVYLDPIGIPTVCYGHTGPEVKMGMRFTDAQCDELLRKDMEVAARTVLSCYPDALSLNPNQFGAFQSFAFNVGPGKRGVKDGFCTLKSGATPSHLRKLRAGNVAGACTDLNQWTKAAGVPLRGLTVRRLREINLCGVPYEAR